MGGAATADFLVVAQGRNQLAQIPATRKSLKAAAPRPRRFLFHIKLEATRSDDERDPDLLPGDGVQQPSRVPP